jgi:hypothetical protein
MKSFQVINSQPILDKLAAAELPIAISVKLLDPFKKVAEIHQTIVEKKQTLFTKYGTSNEETGEISIDPEHNETFTKEYTALMEAELEWKYPPVSLEDFGSTVVISIADVAKIEWFLAGTESNKVNIKAA